MATLSILTPSFNYAWCIEDALQSVAGASGLTPRGWEVEHVVVDGASTDESADILTRWEPRLSLELREENRGIGSNLNRCVALARGEWVGWLNADDFYLERSLLHVTEAFDGDVDVIYGDAVHVDPSGRFLRLMTEHPFSQRTLRWWGTYLLVGTVFLRRSLVERFPFREDLGLLLDWDLWLRAAESGARFRYVPSPLAAIRRHPGQESQQDRPGRLAEKAGVRREHGLPSRPWMWRAAQRVAAIDHGGRKLLSGGYRRQRRASVLSGRSMRWFGNDEGRSSMDTLYETVYGLGSRSDPAVREERR